PGTCARGLGFARQSRPELRRRPVRNHARASRRVAAVAAPSRAFEGRCEAARHRGAGSRLHRSAHRRSRRRCRCRRAQAAADARRRRARICASGGCAAGVDAGAASAAAHAGVAAPARLRHAPGDPARAGRHQALQPAGTGVGAGRSRARRLRRGPGARHRRAPGLRDLGQSPGPSRRPLADPAGGALRRGRRAAWLVAGAGAGRNRGTVDGRGRSRRRAGAVQCRARYPAGLDAGRARMAAAPGDHRTAGTTGDGVSDVPRLPTPRIRGGRMKRTSAGATLRRLLLLLLLAGVVAGGWLWQRYQGFADASLAGVRAGDSLLVERGDNLGSVLRKLQAQGVATGDRLHWQVLARELGAAGRLQVGEYALAADTSPRALLAAMRDGKVVRRNFTIVEGWNIRGLRAALAKVPLLGQDTAQMDDAALMRALGHPGQHPEGRFLPETYAWVRGDSDLDLLRRAYAAMDKALDEA